VKTSKSHRKRDGNKNDRNSRSRRRIHNYLEHSTRRDHAILGPGIIPSVSHVRRQRRRNDRHILQGELRKIKPSHFNGEHIKGEEVDAWLLEMKKYLQLHDYPFIVEKTIATYHLQGKATVWWDEINQAKHLDQKRVSWR
jgi:hypothetical protein